MTSQLILGARDCSYICVVRKLFFQKIKFTGCHAVELDGQYSIAVESRVPLLHIVQLPEYKDRGDHKKDGTGKLSHHKDIPEPSLVLPC